MRFENTWQDQRCSFIQNHSRSFRFTDPWRCFFSSLTHLLQGSGQRTPDKRSETFLHPESLQILQIHRSMTVLLQFTSLIFYRVQVREHLTRDQRSFLHPESLQILQIHRSMTVLLQFISLIFYRVQVREHLTRDQRSILHPESLQILQIHRSMTVLLQFISLMFYRVQAREHLTRDQRSFLHPESLQILQIHRSMTVLLQFTHSSSTGFRSENTWREIRDHSFIQNHSRSFRFTDPWRCFFSSPHSSSTGYRSENTWREIRDHSFIQNHSRSFRFTDPWRCFFSSSHSSSTGFRSEDWNDQQKLGFVLRDPCLCCFWGLCLDYCPVGRSKHGPL